MGLIFRGDGWFKLNHILLVKNGIINMNDLGSKVNVTDDLKVTNLKGLLACYHKYHIMIYHRAF